ERWVRLGVSVTTPASLLADQLDLPKGQGLVVAAVTPNSPAAKAGVRVNDILLELDGKAGPSNPRDLPRLVQQGHPAKSVAVVVMRKGKKQTLEGLTLPQSPARPAAPEGFRWPLHFFPAGGGSSLNLQRMGDQFTASQHEGMKMVTIRG